MIKLSTRLFLFYLMTHTGLVIAESNHFEISPQKCVTLKQGKDCYQDIEVDWQADRPGNYCLTLSTQDIPLKCWSDIDRAKFEFEFVGKQSATLSLIESDTNRLLGKSDIEVKWVYRNRSRNLSWRVF